jgi:hypothetical protein
MESGGKAPQPVYALFWTTSTCSAAAETGGGDVALRCADVSHAASQKRECQRDAGQAR